MSFISNYPKKKITLQDLELHYRWSSYEQTVAFIGDHIKSGRLKPVKASGGNGKRPMLYKMYWIIQDEISYEQYEDELKFRLHPSLNLSFYQQNLKQYVQDHEAILQLSEFLKQHGHQLEAAVSVNERSFQIFKREKFLAREGGKRIVEKVGYDYERLNCYVTAEPIAYYAHHKKPKQNILIIENMDTFYSFRHAMIQNKLTFCNVTFGTLMYGGGKSVMKAFSHFEYSVEPYLLEPGHTYYYYGDLDYEGISIFESLVTVFKCQPFVAAYELLLRQCELSACPETKAGQQPHPGHEFLKYFDDEAKLKIDELLRARRYLPQEALTIHDM